MGVAVQNQVSREASLDISLRQTTATKVLNAESISATYPMTQLALLAQPVQRGTHKAESCAADVSVASSAVVDPVLHQYLGTVVSICLTRVLQASKASNVTCSCQRDSWRLLREIIYVP